MTTRILPLLVLSMMALSTATVGCAAEDTSSYGSLHHKKGAADDSSETAADGTPKTHEARQAVTVKGTTDHADATSVDVMAMGEDGTQTKVATAEVKDGKFDVQLPADSSPTGIFILKVKGIGDAVVGSATLNGIGAFIKGFTIDAAVDAQTTFKTEILDTIAKKGTPGVQNYLNVIDAYVNDQLANTITTDGAITTDVVNITNATAEAIIAAETAIEDSLQKAGFPIDLTELKKWQTSAVAGFTGFVTDAQGQRATTAKNLVAGIQAATSKAAAPIDDAIFNAVVNGGAAFGGKMKEMAPQQGFAATQSAFALQSNISADKVQDAFGGSDLGAKIADATKTFLASVTSAANTKDLQDAQTAFTNVLTGKNQQPSDILAAFKPLINVLTTALKQVDFQGIFKALQDIDLTKLDLPDAFKNALGGNVDMSKVEGAIKSVQKQVAQ